MAAALLAGFYGWSQSCCAPETMRDYEMLASNREFRMSHTNPEPFVFKSQAGGDMVQFKTSDGKMANGFMIKAKSASAKYLFVYQEFWGLNDYIKKQSETFYNDMGGDVNVLAVDLYDGKIGATREEASKLMQSVDDARLVNIIKGAVDYAGKDAQIASVGWCFGGGWSLRSALLEGANAVGCIMYYGMPVKDVEQLKKLNCDVLGFFAGKEKWITTDVVGQFSKDMQSAGKSINYTIFDAEHAFANPSNPKYDKVASEEAYRAALVYLKSKFKA